MENEQIGHDPVVLLLPALHARRAEPPAHGSVVRRNFRIAIVAVIRRKLLRHQIGKPRHFRFDITETAGVAPFHDTVAVKEQRNVFFLFELLLQNGKFFGIRLLGTAPFLRSDVGNAHRFARETREFLVSHVFFGILFRTECRIRIERRVEIIIIEIGCGNGRTLYVTQTLFGHFVIRSLRV